MTQVFLKACLLLGLLDGAGGGLDGAAPSSPVALAEPGAASPETEGAAEEKERSSTPGPGESPGAAEPASAPSESGDGGEPGSASSKGADAAGPVETDDESEGGDGSEKTKAAKKKDAPGLRRYQLPVAEGDETEEETSGSELAEAEDPDTLPLLHHQLHAAFSLGMRVATFPSESLDPFAASDTRVSPHLRLGFYPYARGRLSAGVVSDYVYTQTGSSLRGLESEFVTHRLGLGLEGRYHLTHRVALYGRIVGGAAVSRAQLTPSGDQPFRADSADFRLDSAAGIQARIAGPSDGRQLDLRLSVFLEGGFDYSAAWNGEFRTVSEDIFRDEPISFVGLDTSAPYLATGLVLSY